MKISDLNPEYDKLQQEYGAKELTSIYNGGCTNNPDICFVFMNPTGRNIASDPNWKGRRSPWIGTKNIWKLFYRIGLLDERIYEEIQKRKPQEWDEKFADSVYADVEQHKYFITNLGNQVSSIVLNKNISVSQCRKQSFPRNIAGKNYSVYPVYYPIGNGMMNIDKAIEDLNYIIRTNFKSQKDMDDYER